MPFRKHHLIPTIILVIVLGANFLSVRPVHADGENPPEPPAPTQVATEPSTEPPAEPSAESTPEPVEATPEPVEATATPLAEVLIQAPENTEVIVLDENGDSVSLASQEAAEIAEVTDPMWCPAGVLPGGSGSGCTSNFLTITALINHMRNNPSNYDEPGVIYFTPDPGTRSFTLTDAPTSLGSSFDILKTFDLTLQGGWNGSSSSPAIISETNFGNRPLTIGTDGSIPGGNPWIGNITLNDLMFSYASSTSVEIHTTTGDITLNNVDVDNQRNGGNTALLQSTSGDITVTDGIYDGNNSNSAGFSATTGSGSITISNSSFTENRKPGSGNNSDGATLSAPTVTLTNVTATNNDGNGITINSNTATLYNVVASNNGTDPPGLGGNQGSGVFFGGNLGSSLFVNGGAFDNNKEYGIELANPANTTIYVGSAPSCTNNVSGCTNGVLVDATPPTLTVPPDITTPATGPTGAVVSYTASATDNMDPTLPVTCLPPSGSTFPVGTTVVSCFATDTAGNSAIGNFQVTVTDTTVVVPPTPPAPTPTVPGSGTSTLGFSYSPSGSIPLIIPVTSGSVIDLDCGSAFWAFGIKLSFLGLCDHQTTLNDISPDNLPGALPDGYAFEMGLGVSILSENQAIEELPNGTGIQMDFPILSGSKDQFVVLYWDGSQWIEVSEQISAEEISQFVDGNSGNELFEVDTELDTFYQVLTTNKTGIFVLAKK